MADEVKRKRLIAARKRSGLTQKELSEKLKLSQSSISQYESGKIDLDDEFKDKMAELFKLHPIDFTALENQEMSSFKKQKIPNQLKLYNKKNVHIYQKGLSTYRDIPLLEKINNPYNPNIFPLDNHKRIINTNSNADFAYEYAYDNMSPTILNGDIVFVKLSKKPTTFQKFNGELYLICHQIDYEDRNKEEEIIICRVFSNEGFLTLKSDNYNCSILTVTVDKLDREVIFIGKIIESRRLYK